MAYVETLISPLNQRVPIEFRRSKRARRIRLQINSEGKFTLVVPWLTSKKSVNLFLILGNNLGCILLAMPCERYSPVLSQSS